MEQRYYTIQPLMSNVTIEMIFRTKQKVRALYPALATKKPTGEIV